jgi:hypothetical protein
MNVEQIIRENARRNAEKKKITTLSPGLIAAATGLSCL